MISSKKIKEFNKDGYIVIKNFVTKKKNIFNIYSIK